MCSCTPHPQQRQSLTISTQYLEHSGIYDSVGLCILPPFY